MQVHEPTSLEKNNHGASLEHFTLQLKSSRDFRKPPTISVLLQIGFFFLPSSCQQIIAKCLVAIVPLCLGLSSLLDPDVARVIGKSEGLSRSLYLKTSTLCRRQTPFEKKVYHLPLFSKGQPLEDFIYTSIKLLCAIKSN